MSSLSDVHKHKTAGKYNWEKQYSGAYQILLDTSDQDLSKKHYIQRERRIREKTKKSVSKKRLKKGLVRWLYIIVDMGMAMEIEKDYVVKDNDEKFISGSSRQQMTEIQNSGETKSVRRVEMVAQKLQEFIAEYFDQNPLCQIGVISTMEGTAEYIEMAGDNAYQLGKKLREYFETKVPRGLPSIQNSLRLAARSLSALAPDYASKEILMIYSTPYTTCDPGDIFKTMASIKDRHITCSVIGFGGEMFVLRKLTSITNGRYVVPRNTPDFHDQLMSFSRPIPSSKRNQIITPEMIQMGFPSKRADTMRSFCACHEEVTPGGYICPRCASKYCHLPSKCKICSLMLVSSPHLARSFHHLFPVDDFVDLHLPLLPEEEHDHRSTIVDLAPGEKHPVQPPSNVPTFCFGCQQRLRHSW
eukprot:CAMPEP_0117450464 /NCGR_PEP_ID=MMETSP0759-20121206/8481_1 /TAXON_ID=63605 /ORGANISM="Percolomonas cosmopolitus, Strain WS" /LENGTH=414 /DNA_ID=CAMNT_0005242985 /DNA_START=71 /DNA_END=1312 /DNA_ORIENTATION=+